MKKSIIFALATAFAAVTASATEVGALESADAAAIPATSANELHIGVGTTGATIGYARALSHGVGLRVGFNALTYENTFDTDEATYDAELDMKTAAVYLDYFPFASSSFRLTAGAVSGDRNLNLEGRSRNGTITINGVDYPADGERVYGKVSWPKTAPYLGIGFGHKASESGLSLTADLGVIHGNPTVTLDATPSLKQAAGQSNVDEERRKVQEEADKAKLYPVIRIGIGYSF